MKNIFELNRDFWDFSFSNPEKIRPNHCAVYYFALEHCNRLGWKDKYGFPTSMVMEATGIKSYSVYKKTFDELVEFGFIEVVEYSRNQYSSNVISLCALKENYKAPSKALDKALIKHTSKQCESSCESTSSIIIQDTIDNKTNLPDTKDKLRKSLMSEVKTSDVPEDEKDYFLIADSFLKLFIRNSQEVLKVKWTNLEKATYKSFVDPIRLMITNDGRSREEIQRVYKFLQSDDFWMRNVQSTEKLRKQFDQLITKTVQPLNTKTNEQQQFDKRKDEAGTALIRAIMAQNKNATTLERVQEPITEEVRKDANEWKGLDYGKFTSDPNNAE